MAKKEMHGKEGDAWQRRRCMAKKEMHSKRGNSPALIEATTSSLEVTIYNALLRFSYAYKILSIISLQLVVAVPAHLGFSGIFSSRDGATRCRLAARRNLPAEQGSRSSLLRVTAKTFNNKQ